MNNETEEIKVSRVITMLARATDEKSKPKIREAYDLSETIEMDISQHKSADLYDELVERANEILYS